MSQNADGTLNLLHWAGTKVISGLERLATPGAGTNTLTSESCQGSITDSGCAGTLSQGTYTYALISKSAVAANIQASYTPPETTEE